MHADRAELIITYFAPEDGRVRHLVTEPVDGLAHIKLLQLEGGVELLLTEGTHFEVSTRTDAFTRAWGMEGFEPFTSGNVAFESLEGVIALASKLGFEKVFENGLPTQALWLGCDLSDWRGVRSRSGSYEYAFSHGSIFARASLSREQISKLDGLEILARFQAIVAMRRAVGPERKYQLG